MKLLIFISFALGCTFSASVPAHWDEEGTANTLDDHDSTNDLKIITNLLKTIKLTILQLPPPPETPDGVPIYYGAQPNVPIAENGAEPWVQVNFNDPQTEVQVEQQSEASLVDYPVINNLRAQNLKRKRVDSKNR
jgi:hypothetical protein